MYFISNKTVLNSVSIINTKILTYATLTDFSTFGLFAAKVILERIVCTKSKLLFFYYYH